MQNSKAYDCLIKQLNANGSEKMDGYYPEVMEEIYDWEREEVEDIIWDAFFNKNEIELAQFFPKLKKYDGIKALKESPYLLQIPSEASVEIGKILYEATGDEGYLDIIKKNIDASPETISFVSILSYCKPCQRLYNILVDIYINNSNKVNRSTAVMGILYNKGIIKDRSSIKESNDVISLRKKFKSEDSIEREKILEKFEAVCAMFALDLIGVKVFRYSDETAEAVASGEKLLKESGTIYESFADMMSPEDAKRYLDFLENGSREGLTSAELAGVEKADALLVSQKVGYEDVWDLRNAGDALESGRESSIMDYSNRFADSLAEDFNPGVEVRDVVKEDMILVQFSSDAPNASLRYWTTIDEANGISTIEEYMDKMALSKEWGNRNVVKVARVKKGTEVTHAIGTAKAQTKISDPRPGNGKQILFSKFDSNWITEVRNIKE